MANDDTERGLYNKFNVTRTDGQSSPGCKHDGCQYFVLDLDHDPYALAAVRAYVDRCYRTHPQLANDLGNILLDKSIQERAT